MRNLTIATALTLACLLAAAPGARAAGYAIPAANAREVGLSQATVAAQTGPEAIYQNEAALAGREGFAVSASLEVLYNKTTWTDPASGQEVTILDHPNFPPEIALSYGSKLGNGMAWGIGAGMLIPAGGSLHWPADWPGALRIQTVDQKVYMFILGAALEPFPGLKLGASWIHYRVTQYLSQKLNFLPIRGTGTLGLPATPTPSAWPASSRSPGCRSPWASITGTRET
jgi:long-subunit fatty acid transport protein